MEYYNSINSLRGIFALMIVWHHLCPIFGYPYHYDFGNSIVLFFFILSGFHISLKYKDNLPGKSKTFILKRISKVFPIQILMTLLFVLFGINLVSFWAIPFHLSLTQSLFPFWQINFTLNTPSWFLSSLFCCYLATPLLLKMAKSNLKRFILLYSVGVVFFIVFLKVAHSYFGLRWLSYINPVSRMFDYTLGMIMGLVWNSEWLRNVFVRSGKKTATAIELLSLSSFAIFMMYSPLFAYNCYTVLRYPFILSLILIFTLGRGLISRLLSNRILNWLGSISMSVYMTHEFVLHWMHKISFIDKHLLIVLSYTMVIIFAYLIEKYFVKNASQLIQNRFC